MQDASVLRRHGIDAHEAEAAVHVVVEDAVGRRVASGGSALLLVAGRFAGLRWTRRVADVRAIGALADAVYWLLTRRRGVVGCC